MRGLLSFFILLMCSCSTPQQDAAIQPPEPEAEILVKAKGKGTMILRTDRPANLETPLSWFMEDYTPNSVFFVRWHLSIMPDSISPDTFRLRIFGNVNKKLELSLNDLKSKFEQVTVVALACCSGNARSFLDPQVPGGQWKNGAMGNAKWTGVRLKDLLEMAGIQNGSVEVTFNGMDAPPLPSVPDFIKSLSVEHALNEEVIVAYQMNGEDLPLLNGYPLKLVVPGWYATYWMGMLHEIEVCREPYAGFWMKKAYLAPTGISNANERPDALAKDLSPITKIAVRSIFVSPEPNSIIAPGKQIEMQGLAFDGGDGIVKVEISEDNGRTWKQAKLDPSLGKYSWRRWRYSWTAGIKGIYALKVKATNAAGETQPEHHWNRSGYARNEIETLTLYVQ
jgi:DMSO/TMAO reductase YedYZ molybdopterin-dependent catalytic subunit